MTNNLDDYDLEFEFDFQLENIVRPPDPVKRERLVEPRDPDLLQMLQISETEFYNKKSKEQTILDNIKDRLLKIKGHDTTNKSIYDELESNIQMYELEYIISFELDPKSYSLIKSIRFSKDEMDLLDKLIVKLT
jgi:hypothetical protein